ncbi:hypothetical protein [uncultured Alistipes sp.]|uniref:hypothetical protein n=1 Tax=uncultured Alistipes sp. TaxID=538949 RepID=UPI00261F1D67|nr:hypothetical protein [uncultured Alistipes sp.]
MKRKSFGIIYKPIKPFASMEVGSASSPVQDYDVLTDTHYPDYSLVPLVLIPAIGYSDPNDGSVNPNAAKQLTDGHWYRLDSATTGGIGTSTEIVSGTDYIIDTTAGSATYGMIKIKRNVSPTNPVTYVFRATLVHPNGERVPQEVSFQPRARAVSVAPYLKLDNAAECMYNPWEDTDAWTLNPVLTPTPKTVAYIWESLHGGVWGALGSTRLDWAVEKSGDGVKVRRSVMQDAIYLRLRARITSGGKTDELMAYASVVRRLPKFDYEIHRVCDVTSDVTSISPEAVIKMGGKIIADPRGEVDVKWYNGSGTVIATGMRPVIPLSVFGGNFDLGLDMPDKGGWKALVDDQGRFILDDQGRQILAR